jgi:hypothetical protein
MRLIQIHAGLHKTGTTAIQHTLARLAPDLAQHGVALPYFGSRGHWHHALAGFSTDPERTAEAWTKLTRRVAKTQADRIILSSEHFIGSDPVALRDALARMGDARVQIHIYLRPHIALCTSLHLERVKAGVATSGATDLTRVDRASAAFDYVPAIARLTEIFGPDAIALREFAPAQFTGASLITDFWDFLDLPTALLDTATEGGDVIVNPTPTAEQALLLLALATRLRGARGPSADPQALRRTLSLLHDALRTRSHGPSTPYRLPMQLQRVIKAQFDGPRAALAPRLDSPASAAFLSEPLARPVPLAPIPHAVAVDSLVATAHGLRERDLPEWADAVDDFAHRLNTTPGADGTALLSLPAPRAAMLEGAA